MQTRELDLAPQTSKTPDLIFLTPANWTYVLFFACLGLLHLTIASLAFYQGRWEAYMSLALGILFIATAVVAHRCRFEMSILPGEKRIRLRNGTRRLGFQRYVPFSDVHGVRLTLLQRDHSRIELLCDNEDIECPPTSIPRQEALCLAMLMNVRLIKVCEDDAEFGRAERIGELN